MQFARAIINFINPPVPARIADDFALLAASHLRKQARLMLTGFVASIPMVVMVGSEEASPIITVGLPIIIVIVAMVRLFAVTRRYTDPTDMKQARNVVRRICASSVVLGLVGSAWCLGNWWSAPAETRIYYPLIMSVGALTLSYCLASIRAAAITGLTLTLLPISLVLLATGEKMNIAAAIAFLIAGAFQIMMLSRHHTMLIELLEHKRHARDLSRIDPLTGLLNRRALLDEAWRLGAEGSPLRLMLVDIDLFKRINDSFGHDTGDEVLRRLGEILRQFGSDGVAVTRMGGEEFALLGRTDALPEAFAAKLLSEIRTATMPHGERVTASVGMAEGPVDDDTGWRALYARADHALYEAKNDGRDRVKDSKKGSTLRRRQSRRVA